MSDTSSFIADYELSPEKVATRREKIVKVLKDNLFTIATLIGVIVGFAIGFGVSTIHPSETAISWIKMPGTIYIRCLQLTIVPLIASNIIVVMAKINLRENGKMGIAAIGFVLISDLLSGPVGVITAALIKPGVSTKLTVNNTTIPGPNDAPVTSSDVFQDLLLNIFPDNIVWLTIHQTKTIRRWVNFPDTDVAEPVQTSLDSTNMIGLIFTTIVFGLATAKAGSMGEAFLTFFESLSNVVLIVMRWFIVTTPVGVCFMVAGSVVGLDSVSVVFQGLGLFMVTHLVALAIHMIIQMIAYTLTSFRNPFLLIWAGRRVWFLSFITTSPVIAIPEMLETCEHVGMDEKVRKFVIPFSAALKGDGSGVFQAVACVFIAQISHYNMTAGTYVMIALLTGFATLAIPNVPSAAIIIITTVLTSIGVKTEYVSLLFTIEFLMDRCRSGSIGLGHLFAAGFTNAIVTGRQKKRADPMDEESEGSAQSLPK